MLLLPPTGARELTLSSLRVVSKMTLAGHHGRAVTTSLASDQHREPCASGEPLTTTIRPVQGGPDRSCDHAELAVEEHLFQPMNKQMCEGYTTQLRGSLTAVYVIPTTPAASAIRSNRAPKCFTGAAPLEASSCQYSSTASSGQDEVGTTRRTLSGRPRHSGRLAYESHNTALPPWTPVRGRILSPRTTGRRRHAR